MVTRLTGYVLLIGAVILIAALMYFNSSRNGAALVFSPTLILNSTWEQYKANYLEKNTSRTLDPARDDITTSEGESYTMLRAVWLGDKQTFDASWNWTKNNLQHKSGDHLFSWLFGKQANGTYGVLAAEGGDASASDADTDIALALLFAYARWQDHQYIGDARVIMGDIWSKEVITIANEPYMTADNKEKTSSAAVAIVNPSYLNPAAYRVFGEFDNSHPWDMLATTSFQVIGQSMQSTLGAQHSANLPPDWVAINKLTGRMEPAPGTSDTTNFGFDALRTPWRLALDWQWFKDPRAQQLLSQFTFLSTEWQTNHKLATTYSHAGSVINPEETPAMYGGTIGYFASTNPAEAKDVFETKIASLYEPARNGWRQTLSYYDDNWAWFGTGIYSGLLSNLTASLPTSAFQQ